MIAQCTLTPSVGLLTRHGSSIRELVCFKPEERKSTSTHYSSLLTRRCVRTYYITWVWQKFSSRMSLIATIDHPWRWRRASFLRKPRQMPQLAQWLRTQQLNRSEGTNRVNWPLTKFFFINMVHLYNWPFTVLIRVVRTSVTPVTWLSSSWPH